MRGLFFSVGFDLLRRIDLYLPSLPSSINRIPGGVDKRLKAVMSHVMAGRSGAATSLLIDRGQIVTTCTSWTVIVGPWEV